VIYTMRIHTILLPTRPQPDTVVAIFLLQEFGKEAFPGIETAQIKIEANLSSSDSFESLLQEGKLAIDVGGGIFDHHNTGQCASDLIATYFSIEEDPALQQLLTYARRDDQEGKGTLSSDPIDRAFGLSGLISALNKLHVHNPQETVTTALPLVRAHYASAREHHTELPREVEAKKLTGDYVQMFAQQQKKKLSVAYVISDKPSMPTYLRSFRGQRVDIVVQKLENSNHISILTKQDRKVDLSKTMAFIRLREAQLQNVELSDESEYIQKTGRIDEVPYWYYDPATNSLLNGSPHNRSVKESLIPWEEMKKIVRAGIEMDLT
jgi:hypothetical protein